MRHFKFRTAFLLGISLVSCNDHKENATHDTGHQENAASSSTIAATTDNKQEIEEYRVRMNALLDKLEADIEDNKELKLLEKDKKKKEAYELTIEHLQELRAELKDKKDHFDDRSNKAWKELKEELDYIFSRNPSDDRNDPDRSGQK
jgi:hypothetical protein